MRNGYSGANRLLARLASEKKKSVVALSLIAVMAFMWIRVFAKKGPVAADAAFLSGSVDPSSQIETQVKVSFVELPRIPGRNDVISRDFFAADGWRTFGREVDGNNLGDTQEVDVISTDGSEEVVARLTERLKLQAIESGDYPRAFVNDRLLLVGDRFPVSDGTNMYECEVLSIEENEVSVKCEDAEIVLKLARAAGITD